FSTPIHSSLLLHLSPTPSPSHLYLHSFPTRRSSDLAWPHRLPAHRDPFAVQGAGAGQGPGALCRGRRRGLGQADHSSLPLHRRLDRKSTRLNSSHVKISYAVFCLKKKKIKKIHDTNT